MQVEKLLATASGDRQYGDLLRDACAAVAPQQVRAALAYATQSGVAELCDALNGLTGWGTSQKQWLVGIDYCRSDPLALSHLHGLPNSAVRVHDGQFVVARAGCNPRVSFHPKLYLLTGQTTTATIVGSGNLSRTGMRFGIEAAASLRSREDAAELVQVSGWYRRLWTAATPWPRVAAAYSVRYADQANRQQPAPIEDDAAPESAGRRGQLTPEQLRQLRVCEHLWIEAGNLHANRGPNRPGNQLMLKRNTRVFFGFQARELARDTTIGEVAIRYGTHDRPDCSLRFSNNSMDVLTLPLPGDGGPAEYDQKVLHFHRVGVRRFVLELGNATQIASWRRRSDQIGGTQQMAGGRAWGVF